jgi:uncharacterized protein (DUF2267 family)
MSADGLDAFDKTLQVTNIWLDEIMRDLGPDRQVAWHALGAVLRTARDRLPIELGAHFGAQLPLLIRGLYYDQWKPEASPAKWRTQQEFIELVTTGLHGIRPVDPVDAARAVFKVVNHHLDPGQVLKIKEALPEDVRRLWPESRVGVPRRNAA